MSAVVPAGGGGFGKIRFKVPVVARSVAQGPDDLAIAVDAMCKGMAVHNGIVDGGENAPAIEEGVGAAGVEVMPDDLARVVDATCPRAHGGEGSSMVM
jgi:hypothetical protein